MTPLVRVSESTKQRLAAMKRGDESFDELVNRLVDKHTHEEVREMAGFAERDIAEHMKRKRRELNESLV